MRRVILFFVILSTCGLSFGASETVILLSWDGMRHDFLDRGDFPALKQVEQQGIRAKKLTPVFPPNTFPGHVSLATGAKPAQHGIIGNTFYDREKGLYSYSNEAHWINAEPLWVTAERQGVKTAVYFWVGSETDWQGVGASYRIAPFDGRRSEAKKVDQIIDWLDLPAGERPRLIMSYWQGADTVAHVKGPDHEDVANVIAAQDKELGRLIKALNSRDLWPNTTLMIVSDHGMATVNRSVEIKTALEDAGFALRITGGSAVQHIFLDHQDQKNSVLSILHALPHITVFSDESVPAALSTLNRTGDIVVTTSAPHTLTRAETLLAKIEQLLSPMLGWDKGAHGFNPATADMSAIFLAMGRGVTPGQLIPEIHQLEVAPTVARLLGIEPPANAIRRGIQLNAMMPMQPQKSRAPIANTAIEHR